jgi:hypothetical protein
MCLTNEKAIDIKACYGYAVQIKLSPSLRQPADKVRYRGIYNGNYVYPRVEQHATHLRTCPNDAGFYGFTKLEDARKLYRKEPYNERVIVLCEFRNIFEIGNPQIYAEPWEEKITAFRAEYRTILCEVPARKPRKR